MSSSKIKSYNKGGKKRDRFGDSKPGKRRAARKLLDTNSRVDRIPRFQKQHKPMDPIKMEGLFDTLIPEVQHALRKEGYTIPTPVQSQAIPPQIDSEDLFGLSLIHI